MICGICFKIFNWILFPVYSYGRMRASSLKTELSCGILGAISVLEMKIAVDIEEN